MQKTWRVSHSSQVENHHLCWQAPEPEFRACECLPIRPMVPVLAACRTVISEKGCREIARRGYHWIGCLPVRNESPLAFSDGLQSEHLFHVPGHDEEAPLHLDLVETTQMKLSEAHY